jgi:hypothetical protein
VGRKLALYGQTLQSRRGEVLSLSFRDNCGSAWRSDKAVDGHIALRRMIVCINKGVNNALQGRKNQ